MSELANVRSLPGRWAENLTLWEAVSAGALPGANLWEPTMDTRRSAEPVRFGDHGGRDVREHDNREPNDLASWAGAA